MTAADNDAATFAALIATGHPGAVTSFRAGDVPEIFARVRQPAAAGRSAGAAVVFAPPRSGMGVAVVVPNLLTWRNKGEI